MSWSAHRCFLAAAGLALVCTPARAGDKPRKPVPPGDAKTYALHDTHDGITIAADPGDVKEAVRIPASTTSTTVFCPYA